jgi:hypothetical protein
MERNNNSSYIQKGDRVMCEILRGIALGNAACRILVNIILGKIKPCIEITTGDNQNVFSNGRSIICAENTK